MAKKGIDTLESGKARLRAEIAQTTYEKLARKYHVNKGDLWKLINRPGYIPTPKLCARLGITMYRPAPVCPKCGQVHVTRRCTQNTRRTWRGWLDYPIEELARLIAEREKL